MHDGPKEPNDRHSPALDGAAVQKIGEKLRHGYSGIVDAPVPDRFTALLQRLEKEGAPRQDN